MTTQSKFGAAVPYLHLVERIVCEASEWPEPNSILVNIFWKGVDRPQWGGVALRPEERALAKRLRDVIARGDAFEHVEVKTDINGQTYMSVHNRFSVVELDEDLDTLDHIGPRAGATVGKKPRRRRS